MDSPSQPVFAHVVNDSHRTIHNSDEYTIESAPYDRSDKMKSAAMRKISTTISKKSYVPVPYKALFGNVNAIKHSTLEHDRTKSETVTELLY